MNAKTGLGLDSTGVWRILRAEEEEELELRIVLRMKLRRLERDRGTGEQFMEMEHGNCNTLWKRRTIFVCVEKKP